MNKKYLFHLIIYPFYSVIYIILFFLSSCWLFSGKDTETALTLLLFVLIITVSHMTYSMLGGNARDFMMMLTGINTTNPLGEQSMKLNRMKMTRGISFGSNKQTHSPLFCQLRGIDEAKIV